MLTQVIGFLSLIMGIIEFVGLSLVSSRRLLEMGTLELVGKQVLQPMLGLLRWM